MHQKFIAYSNIRPMTREMPRHIVPARKLSRNTPINFMGHAKRRNENRFDFQKESVPQITIKFTSIYLSLKLINFKNYCTFKNKGEYATKS